MDHCHFDTPTGITGDGGSGAINYVYIADAGNNAIQRIDMTTGDFNLDTIAVGDVLNTPFGLTFVNGYLYITSFNGHNIIRFEVSRYGAGGSPAVSLTTSDIYAGSVVGRFGHLDASSPLDSITMHPTGIDHDDNGIIYFNEWYKVPGELWSTHVLQKADLRADHLLVDPRVERRLVDPKVEHRLVDLTAELPPVDQKLVDP